MLERQYLCLILKILDYKNFNIQKFKHGLENNTYIHFFQCLF